MTVQINYKKTLAIALGSYHSMSGVSTSYLQYNYDPFRCTGVRLHVDAPKGTKTTLKNHEQV